jgi:hypothetical protein
MHVIPSRSRGFATPARDEKTCHPEAYFYESPLIVKLIVFIFCRWRWFGPIFYPSVPVWDAHVGGSESP